MLRYFDVGLNVTLAAGILLAVGLVVAVTRGPDHLEGVTTGLEPHQQDIKALAQVMLHAPHCSGPGPTTEPICAGPATEEQPK